MVEGVDVSVVIPTFNKAVLLQRTLLALGDQVLPPGRSWEVVVVSDGCTDGTSVLLQKLAINFPVPLHAVEPGSNVGRAKARNLGLAQARGRWVLFLDDDILAPNDLIAAHIKLLEVDDHCGTIGYAKTDPSLVDAPHFYYLDSRGIAHGKELYAPSRFFVTQNAAVPRWALVEVGGFAEDFSAYGFEDMELAFRLEDQCGIKFFGLREPVPVHIHHHTFSEYLAKKVECGRYSLPLLAKLHPRRIAEMKLVVAVKVPRETPSFLVMVGRSVLDSPLAKIPYFIAAHWPCVASFRPRWPRLYFSVMNLTVLSCFRRGVRRQ